MSDALRRQRTTSQVRAHQRRHETSLPASRFVGEGLCEPQLTGRAVVCAAGARRLPGEAEGVFVGRPVMGALLLQDRRRAAGAAPLWRRPGERRCTRRSAVLRQRARAPATARRPPPAPAGRPAARSQACTNKEAPKGSLPLATCAIQELQDPGRRGTFGFTVAAAVKTGRGALLERDEWRLRAVSESARSNWTNSLWAQQGTCECPPRRHALPLLRVSLEPRPLTCSRVQIWAAGATTTWSPA